MKVAQDLQSIAVVCLLLTSVATRGQAQQIAAGYGSSSQSDAASQVSPATQNPTPAAQPTPQGNGTLKPRPSNTNPEATQAQMTAEEAEALRISKLAIINGRPYDQPSTHDQFIDYLNDSYGLPALGRTAVRAVYSEARDAPSSWGQDFPGFMQRYGAYMGSNAITGNVRFGMELLFHEDLRYIPCHGCRFKRKIENALLAEITARHDEDGHRFFTLTPTIADFTGPIIAHQLYFADHNPAAGAVSARLAFATRIGSHLFTEFVLERRHKDKPIDR